MAFKLIKKDKNSFARLGKLRTGHGTIQTPCFMPIATCASIKSLDSIEMEKLDADIILGNTYHLYLRPGDKIIKKLGGLHGFMNWQKPILTDSGGYQVFSLSDIREITEKGVRFRSHIDGSYHMLTPEKSVDIQLNLGSDIIMVLDECAPYPATKEYIEKSLEMTSRWAKRCKSYFLEEIKKSQTMAVEPMVQKISAQGGCASDAKNQNDNTKFKNKKALLFGIVQGGAYKDLRMRSAKQLIELDFDGYAIGGVSVGEPSKKMFKAVDWVAPILPENKPRYLMGVGKPEEIVGAVARGMDMFDCVIPTRNARHGTIYKFKNQKSKIKIEKKPDIFYEILRITNEKFKSDKNPIDKNCECFTCRNYSRAYLRHLFVCKELLALRLATIHNVYFYLEMMKKVRNSIR